MIRRWLFAVVLVLATAWAALVLQTPRPAPTDAPATAFSAGRAMVDIREMARAPHPTGSVENARVRAYLAGRMTAMGLDVSTQDAALSAESTERLAGWGDPEAASRRLVNVIGVLPGQDRTLPAVVMMAHHDTTWLSPGAADDTTGVAAILEAVRAIQARGEPLRDIIVLITDAEELGLDGARAFFEESPLAARAGVVVNLEARGGGGRAGMFETGPANAETIAIFARAMRGVDGGVASSSAAVMAYETMPNGTDYTIARDRGVPGVNFAFAGRASHYHTAGSTPEALDQGSVQHIGAQALEAADAFARSPSLPRQTVNSVYSDVLGAVVVTHPGWVGWLLLGLTALLGGYAAWRARQAGGLTLKGAGRGILDGLALVATGLVALGFMRAMAGGPVEGAADYYVMLARLLWLEGGGVLAVIAIVLALLAGGAVRRFMVPAVIVVMAGLAFVILGFDVVTGVAALVAIGIWLLPRRDEPEVWGGWLGLIGLIFVLGCAVQAAAPEAAYLLVWPVLLAAGAAAIAALFDPRLARPAALIAPAVATLIGGAWLISFAHMTFIMVGMDLPVVLAVFGLLVLMLARPLAPSGDGARRVMGVTALGLLVVGAGVAGAARLAEPMGPDLPGYKAGVSD
jgi:hypothetical protein